MIRFTAARTRQSSLERCLIPFASNFMVSIYECVAEVKRNFFGQQIASAAVPKISPRKSGSALLHVATNTKSRLLVTPI